MALQPYAALDPKRSMTNLAGATDPLSLGTGLPAGGVQGTGYPQQMTSQVGQLATTGQTAPSAPVVQSTAGQPKPLTQAAAQTVPAPAQTAPAPAPFKAEANTAYMGAPSATTPPPLNQIIPGMPAMATTYTAPSPDAVPVAYYQGKPVYQSTADLGRQLSNDVIYQAYASGQSADPNRLDTHYDAGGKDITSFAQKAIADSVARAGGTPGQVSLQTYDADGNAKREALNGPISVDELYAKAGETRPMPGTLEGLSGGTTRTPGGTVLPPELRTPPQPKSGAPVNPVGSIDPAPGAGGGLPNAGGGAGGGQYARLTPFGESNNLIGQQINPQDPSRSRAQIAAETLALFDEQSAPHLEQQQRRVGQQAAKFGRIGAGMTTNQLTDLSLAQERERNQLQRYLANDAAGMEMNDIYRGAEFTRGERDYQYGLSRDATEDQVRQRLLEEELLNSSFGRDQRRIESLLPYAYGGTGGGALQQAANYYGSLGAQGSDALMEALYNYGQRRAGGK